MKNIYRITIAVLIFIVQINDLKAQNDWQWVHGMGGFSTGGQTEDERILGMEVDDRGNVYIAGVVFGTFHLGGQQFSIPFSSRRTAFIAMFNCEGQLVWNKMFSGTVNTYTTLVDDFRITPDYKVLVNISSGGLGPNDHVLINGTDTLYTGSRLISLHSIDSLGNIEEVFDGVSNNSALIRAMDISDDGKINVITWAPSGRVYDGNYVVRGDTNYYVRHSAQGQIEVFKPIIVGLDSTAATSYNMQLFQNSTGDFILAGEAASNFAVLGGDTVKNIDYFNWKRETFVICFDSAMNYKWMQQSHGLMYGQNFYLDADDHLLVQFQATDTTTFGSEPPGFFVKRSNFFVHAFMVIDRNGDVIYYDNYVFNGSQNSGGYSVAKQGNKIAIGTNQRTGAFGYGSVTYPSSPWAGNPDDLRKGGFFEFDMDLDDGVQHQFIDFKNVDDLLTTNFVRYDPAGNIIIAGRWGSGGSIAHNGQNIPFRGGRQDMFLAKFGAATCQAPVPDTCGIPQQLSATVQSADSVLLQWQSSDSLSNVQYGVAGAAFSSGTFIGGIAIGNLQLENLQAATTYEFYVQDSCPGIGSGTWQGPILFTTDTLPVFPPDTCAMPTQIGVNVLSSDTVEVLWLSSNGLSNLQYGLPGQALQTGTFVGALSGGSFLINQLQAVTTYEVYVQDSCENIGSSAWLGPETFTTLPTSVKNLEAPQGMLSLYPNPSKGEVFIEGIVPQKQVFQVVDLQGRFVFSGTCQSNVVKLPASMPNGIYIFQLENSTAILRQKFVLQR